MKNHKPFNWKLVLIALAIITVTYFIAAYFIQTGKINKREQLYCYFDRVVTNQEPHRDECGIIKIVSHDLDQMDMSNFYNSTYHGQCSNDLTDLPECEGETLHFTTYFLRQFCRTPNCNVDGVLCAAYYITYTADQTYRLNYEESFFTEPNVGSETELLSMLEECDV